ncbi:MAG: PEP-utilizing enzyme [Myxococcales bacterium]|nr:PEP-utilizing enzyme [Myxococcales bacterium]
MQDRKPYSAPGRAGAARPLAQRLDEHAEMRELLALIYEAPDARILNGLLQRLDALLVQHFEGADADAVAGAHDGSKRGDGAAPPGTAAERAAARAEILIALRDLRGRVEAADNQPVSAVRSEVDAFVTRLERHARRAGLDDEALVLTPGETPGASAVMSQGLLANLRRTAVDVAIPEEQTVLLDMTASLYGVHEATRRLLREINHRYIGWPQTVEELHRRATSDLAYYLAQERAADAIDVFASLYARAVAEATPPALRETAVRHFIAYLSKVVTECGASWPHVCPSIERALAQLTALLEAAPALAPAASPRVRRLAQALRERNTSAAQATLARAIALLCVTLRRVYERWLALEDPIEAWRAQARSDDGAAPPEPVRLISHANLTTCLETLDAEPQRPRVERADTLLALPDDAQIQRAYLDAAASLGAGEPGLQRQAARIRWLIHLLAEPALAGAHERALGEINRAFQGVLRAADRAGLVELLGETFAAMRQSELARSPTALNLIERIGSEILVSGDPELVQPLIDELLVWDLPQPHFEGYTDDWQVRVDPAHLRAIRTYLALIQVNPERARPLIAALMVNLHLGGVFIADTDLFQRDVSRLLNANIAPVYHPIKHLLKRFPVYFSDIGSEGELRDASSRIDEIGGRRDRLCHFLRKQCHVESNPSLAAFVEAIAHFFATGEREPLRHYVPPSLYDDLDVTSDEWASVHRVFSRLTENEDLATLFHLDAPALARRIEALGDEKPVDREKAAVLFQLRRLIGAKYELHHDDALERLASMPIIKPTELETLRAALAEARHEEALAMLVSVLERLGTVILRPERTQGFEDIYRKRHIAVGIPSIYGRYTEEKFEALGLSLRLESLVNALFDHLVSEQDFALVTRTTLERVQYWLHLMLRAVRVDGCRGRGLASGLAMLGESLQSAGVSVDQYINIFQQLSRGVEQLIRIRFLDLYEPVLSAMLPRMLERGSLPRAQGSNPRDATLKISEEVLRDLISQSLALPQIDALVGRVLRSLLQAREKLEGDKLSALMTYDGERVCVAIDRCKGPLDGAVHLGNKGSLIKRLALDGLPVPPGFMLTTELFRCREALRSSPALRNDIAARIRGELARLEHETQCRLGDPSSPLLLSVRSSSTISMPGILDTLLNVGMNEAVAEGFAARTGSLWGAWDAYRRLLQFWGMGHGLERNRFDALMRDAKARAGARKKSQLAGDQMRELALRYRRLVQDAGVPIIDDPFEQLLACVHLVLDSWSSEKARLYRRELHIAEEWGTAVIVQSMVYGNLHERAGTGVVFTCDPRRSAPGIHLYGDFTNQAQGDDIVSGLVETFSISEDQRRSESKDSPISLEKNFPQIYAALKQHAHTLIYDQGMFHQEIEFTFESENPADLYLLQTRDLALSEGGEVAAFIPEESLESSLLATGIGAGTGALCGRCAHSNAEIDQLLAQHPSDPIILLRPDTVPDDLPLIMRVAGMVTALGGATSHAALAAQRLGRVCVVGCRQLEVDEGRGRSTLAGHTIKTGDFLSINGSDGSIYIGHHPTVMVRRETGPARLEATG